MITVVVAVGAGVGDTDAEADGVAEGFTVELGDELGDAPGLQEAGAGNDDADGAGVTAAEPEAFNVVPKIAANINVAEIAAMIERI